GGLHLSGERRGGISEAPVRTLLASEPVQPGIRGGRRGRLARDAARLGAMKTSRVTLKDWLHPTQLAMASTSSDPSLEGRGMMAARRGAFSSVVNEFRKCRWKRPAALWATRATGGGEGHYPTRNCPAFASAHRADQACA